MIIKEFPDFLNQLLEEPISAFHNPFENARQGQFERYIVISFRTWWISKHPKMKVFCEMGPERYDMVIEDVEGEKRYILEFKSSHGVGSTRNRQKHFFDKAEKDIDKLKSTSKKDTRYVISTWVEVTGQNPDRDVVDGVISPKLKPCSKRIADLKQELTMWKKNMHSHGLKNIEFGIHDFSEKKAMSILWSIMQVS